MSVNSGFWQLTFAVAALVSIAVAQDQAAGTSIATATVTNTQRFNQRAAADQVLPSDSPASTSQPTAAAAESTPEDSSAEDTSGSFVFRKEVEEVILYATVFDGQRNLVPALERNAFTVVVDGSPQSITSFRRQDVPVAMGIVVDNSGSMRDKREEVTRAVLNLIRASNPEDQIFVVNFSEKYYLDQDFTADVKLLESALRQTSSTGSTALYDAIFASAVHLTNNRQLDKRVLLVITDGQDNMSQETLKEVSLRLQHAPGLTVYAIGLVGGELHETGRHALQQLAEVTGGVAYFPSSLDQVASITSTVAHDIRSQYIIAYKSQNQGSKLSGKSIAVEAHAVGYKDLTVRTRSGSYSAPESSH